MTRMECPASASRWDMGNFPSHSCCTYFDSARKVFVRAYVRRALRRRWRKDLQYPKGLAAVVESMMPGIATKEDGLSWLHPVHFACFRVGDDHDAAQYIENLVGCEDRAKLLRVPEGTPGRQTKEQLMNPVAGDIYPVCHLSSLGIAPGGVSPGHRGWGSGSRRQAWAKGSKS